MNIRVNLNYPIKDGTEVVFRSPVDCSQITGLKLYYLGEDGIVASKEFMLADAHGNNVGDIDHLFAENVAVKVILDVTHGMAFVQNADTNAYLEGRLAAIESRLDNGAAVSDEQYFEATEDGVLSLKEEYRGAAGSEQLPKNLVIPDSVGGIEVTSISSGAFADNLTIESISIPDAVKEIPDNCFLRCYNLKSVKAAGIERIGNYSLYSTNIAVVNFPNVTSIGYYAFAYSLAREVNLPSLANDGMGEGAFAYCSQLETVNAGNLTNVPVCAFYGCHNLQAVTSKAGITSIGMSAFCRTPKLTEIDISQTATDIQAYAFYISGFEYDWETLSDCEFGICATWKQLNPTDIWGGLTIKECENPLPTLLNQNYTGWADRQIGESGKYYRSGCVLFSFIHAYCGLFNMKLESVEDFESIANSYEVGILDKFASSMSATCSVFCPAFGLSYKHDEIKSPENLQEIYDALADGKYVVVGVGKAVSNDYSGLSGHIALIYGVRKDGKLLVADSGGNGSRGLYGNTSAIHYKHLLHTDEVNGNATDYYIISNGEPTMSDVNNKLDALLQNASFRIVPGTAYRVNDARTAIYFPISEQPKMLIWRATDDTQSRINSVCKASGDNTIAFPYGGILNFVTDFDAVSSYATLNQNSIAFSLKRYSSKATMPYAEATAQKYENGEVYTEFPNITSVFDNGDGTTTPAEYEWTAYYWDE